MLIWGPRLIQVRGDVWRVIYLPQQKSHGVNLGPRAIWGGATLSPAGRQRKLGLEVRHKELPITAESSIKHIS